MNARRTRHTALVLLVAAFTIVVGSAAGAVENPDYTAPPPSTPVTVLPAKIDAVRARPAVAAPSNTGVTNASKANQRLAITGSETTQLVVIGALLVAGGSSLLVVRRRTATA